MEREQMEKEWRTRLRSVWSSYPNPLTEINVDSRMMTSHLSQWGIGRLSVIIIKKTIWTSSNNNDISSNYDNHYIPSAFQPTSESIRTAIDATLHDCKLHAARGKNLLCHNEATLSSLPCLQSSIQSFIHSWENILLWSHGRNVAREDWCAPPVWNLWLSRLIRFHLLTREVKMYV